MELTNNETLKIKIDNYSGPLEALLDLAKAQKVDLANISITQLADQFIEFISSVKKINLYLASEYLLMATWLAYLKSKLLLPEEEDDNFKAGEVAERLKLQLKKLELIRLLSDQLLKGNRLGINVYMRGMTGGIRSLKSSKYAVSLYELLKSYSSIIMQKDFLIMNIPKLPVLTAEDGIKRIKEFFGKLTDWKNMNELIPDNFSYGKNLRRSGTAGVFAGSLELVKEGNLVIKQDKLYDNVYIKEK